MQALAEIRGTAISRLPHTRMLWRLDIDVVCCAALASLE